jgi:hypothetical protein
MRRWALPAAHNTGQPTTMNGGSPALVLRTDNSKQRNARDPSPRSWALTFRMFSFAGQAFCLSGVKNMDPGHSADQAGSPEVPRGRHNPLLYDNPPEMAGFVFVAIQRSPIRCPLPPAIPA